MFSTGLLVAVSLAYISLLFVIAWWGDRRARGGRPLAGQAVIYSLSLAVYCTSWTFYGAVGQAASSGWDFLPVYLGPILMFVVFGAFMMRMIRVAKEQSITSISDFIASRFGKSRRLAVLVTAVAVIGVLPYIALQLKAVAMGFDLLSAAPDRAFAVLDQPRPIFRDTALAAALVLALFTILFGTRQLAANEHHPGLMLAVAFESLVKLVAFLAVGIFVTWSMFDGPGALQQARIDDEMLATLFSGDSLTLSFLSILLLSALAVFCLPRQFHVAVVESTSPRDVRAARWLFPAYLVAISLFIVPVAVAGLLTFGDRVEPDTFMLSLPMSAGKEWLTLLAMIGGFSAATGMVIVAAVALSNMVSNDIVMPALLRALPATTGRSADLGRVLLVVRRVVIVALLLLAWAYYRLFGYAESLAGIGLLSFAAVAQFAPLMVAAVLSREVNRHGAIWGLWVGFGLWFYTLLLPMIARTYDVGQAWLEGGPLGLTWLHPERFFGLDLGDSLSHGVIWSLSFNTLALVIGSWLGTARPIDRIQANAYIGVASGLGTDSLPRSGIASVGDFLNLTRRFLGERRTREAFAEHLGPDQAFWREDRPADAGLVRHTERVLASVIGASSARVVLTSALTGSGLRFDQVASLLDQTSQKLKFRHELLQTAMENLSEGISVIDGDLRLVAWNRAYLELFEYPDGLVRIGRPIEEMLYCNARRGMMGPGDVDELVERRLHWMRQGSPHFFERHTGDGRVIEIRGNPMPGGGFVTSFTDVTDRQRAEEALRESERNIRFYTDNVPALLAYVDGDLTFQFTNRAYEKMLGLEREELIGRHLHEVFDQHEMLRRSPYLEGALAGERQDFELELRDADNRQRYAVATYIPQFSKRGEVLGFFSLLQDITERRRAELKLQEAKNLLEKRVAERTRELTELNRELNQEIRVRSRVEEALRQAKHEADEANQSKTRFLAAASHDLLQPLNAARLFVSALEQQAGLDSGQRHLVDRLEGSIHSAEELLSALLDISRLDAGAMPSDVREFGIGELLETLHGEFGPVAQERGLRFDRVGSRARVVSDPKLLRRVLQNFLSNALRYTRQGRVLIGCRRRDGHLMIQVLDTGPGIPADQTESIFREFHRLHESRRSEERGLGLGLAIVERIARILDHPITLRSQPGRGTLFAITVPLASGVSAPLPAAPVGRRRGRDLVGTRVLCVDNEPDILAGMVSLIGPWGCEVRTACDEQEALQVLADTGLPDVILADYHLDEAHNGIDLMNRLRARFGIRVPGILITADQTDVVRNEARANGYRVLHKPLKPAALRALLSRVASLRERHE
ncbi:MAG: PAS domain S-box protein [Wenzhouxiangella sp.]|nr:MAG: PAS domain S-box protein [Wenzhouxiangella sp.]